MEIHENILETLGNTPLVKLGRFHTGGSAVPCFDPHDAEVYAIFDIEGSAYPGDNAIGSATDLGCYKRFQGFVGHAYETSVLDIYSLHPLEDGWVELDDREVVCSVVNYDGSKLTGSQAGAGI